MAEASLRRYSDGRADTARRHDESDIPHNSPVGWSAVAGELVMGGQRADEVRAMAWGWASVYNGHMTGGCLAGSHTLLQSGDDWGGSRYGTETLPRCPLLRGGEAGLRRASRRPPRRALRQGRNPLRQIPRGRVRQIRPRHQSVQALRGRVGPYRSCPLPPPTTRSAGPAGSGSTSTACSRKRTDTELCPAGSTMRTPTD